MALTGRRGYAANSYGQQALEAEILSASPHRIIQMLMEGALEKLAFARGSIARNDLAAKSKNISWAISIINGLRGSLDMEKGGEIALNLSALYDYMTRRLIEANNRNDVATLDEVSGLLMEVKGGWDAIPEEHRGAPAAG